MDTKWKNRKEAISFIIFFLGISLMIGGIAGILQNKPGGARLWQLDKILENDYQQSGRFREYMADRLENFLIMASGGVPVNTWEYDSGIYYDSGYGIVYDDYYYEDYYQDGGYYDSGYYEDYWNSYNDREEQLRDMEDTLEEMQESYRLMLDGVRAAGADSGGYEEELEAFREQIEDYQKEIEDYQSSMEEDMDILERYGESGRKTLTAEQKKEIAENYHNRIKADKNLLYSVASDGKVLYSNYDFPAITGNTAEKIPEGIFADISEEYNFFLIFDGEKVRIFKDGKELNVYGDGYYRDGTDWHDGSCWYVPGYRNFPVDESMKKVTVCMAAAKEPVFYTEGAYGNIGSRQLGNSLYWMNYNCQTRQAVLLQKVLSLALGAGLFILSVFSRKSRRGAVQGIALFQGKIWVECKAALVLGLLYILFIFVRKNNYEYGIWQELTDIYNNEYSIDAVANLSLETIRNIPSWVWIALFWMIYFVWIDLWYNKKVWKHGLIVKLYRTFSVKALKQPLSRKMADRNTIFFVCAVIYGLLMAGAVILGMTGNGSVWGTGLVVVLGTACFLTAACLAGRKNMETAKDMEVVAIRVGEIRDGNYGDLGGQFAGHDLEDMMAQLEDIRHGMAKAVEEQMKSERMKVELIANVSHDIKTPLTSIISYVQFLKQEEGLPEHVKDYVTILDEKSQRLKNMVQDVFAVSKAASGELPMHMEELDFGKLLYQTIADMEEEIDKSAVTFRTEIPDSPVMIMADGQRMYRVFQNLFQNAIKYSLDGSRVYVILKTDGERALASVKNTSQMELDKNKDFVERFARGDQSRTDGGSGLGLSIAQSFTEACGGEFSWETDADLFVVRVSFKEILHLKE